MLALRAHGVTRPAPGGEVNEDALHLDVAAGLFVVADGLAGRPAGEVASEVAVATVVHELNGGGSGSLVEAFDRANLAVVERAHLDDRLAGMAAAATGLRFGVDPSPSVELVHAGDCRAYLLRDGRLRALTVDHLVLRDDTRVITKVLGRPRDLDADVSHLVVHDGDRWLLCTDGLTKVVSDDDIHAVLRGATDATVAVGGLLDAARAGGTPDDVTISVIDVHVPETIH